MSAAPTDVSLAIVLAVRVSQDEAGHPALEIWHGERKITFYTHGYGQAVLSWGANVETEMTDVFPGPKGRPAFIEAYRWLLSGTSAEAPRLPGSRP